MTSILPVSWHPALLGVLLAATAGFVAASTRDGWDVGPRQRWCFAGAIAALLAAYWWPLGDLAAHVSLAALVLQRLVVLLCVAPLLMSSLPTGLVVWLTRPAPVDAVVVACSKPQVAALVVTVVGTASLVPGVVAWTLATPGAIAILAVVNLLLGVVLWLPVLGVVPGARRVGTVGKGVYMLVSSLIVTVFSIVWIFARHPLYGSFHHQRLVLGISPLLDQQVAGFVAKLGAYVPMWIIAFVLLARSSDAATAEEPLRWADVERELERGDRRGRAQEPSSSAGHGLPE